ncbi:site-2 protease family protein [Enterovibrio norvegicus]|uniref:site-2 protease family protein n=1 Tax=Enterovibrio norvegicus TaxID=188144 RepID=UPI003D142CFB
MDFIFASLAFLTSIHILTMAFVAERYGIEVRKIIIGLGPTLFKYRKIEIRCLPLTGMVKLLDSRVDDIDTEQRSKAFDHQSRWVRASIILSGSFVLVAISFLLSGVQAFASLVSGFEQFLFSGVPGLSALYYEQIQAVLVNETPMQVFSLVAIKLAAINLFPFTFMNGGAALIELFGIPEKIASFLHRISLAVFILMMVGWCFFLMGLLV